MATCTEGWFDLTRSVHAHLNLQRNRMATTVHFTIPTRFSDDEHPFGATPDDWFDVVLDEPADQASAELSARILVNRHFGDHIWASTHLDGPQWDKVRERHFPGRSVRVLRVDDDGRLA